MLFEPPIDDLIKKAGNVYIATVIISARAKELENKIPAIEYAAKELYQGKIKAVPQTK